MPCRRGLLLRRGPRRTAPARRRRYKSTDPCLLAASFLGLQKVCHSLPEFFEMFSFDDGNLLVMAKVLKVSGRDLLRLKLLFGYQDDHPVMR